MTEESTYSYKILEDRPFVAIIQLGINVLGGNDALAFSSKLYELCNTDVKYIILDLSNVELMNSSGLGMLVSGLSTLKKYNISLLLTNLPAKVSSLLKMTHLNEILNIYETVDSALVDCI
jgi:anti-sigma B factor antagonist